MGEEISASKYMVTASWEDAPHLDEKTKAELLAAPPPYLRDPRSKGIPSLAAGAIFPIEISEIEVAPFQLPNYWPRSYSLDVGWNRTACIWMAWDRSVDCMYLYTEHYRGRAEPSIHAAAIKARGDWIPGVIDPAARGRMQTDGEQLIQTYRDLGLKVNPYDNSVESGLYEVWERLSTGRLKVFSTLQNWKAEYRLYRRDENGKVIKQFDHLMDATRGLVLSGRSVAICRPANGIGSIIGSGIGGDPATAY
jgi:hypothetical protein